MNIKKYSTRMSLILASAMFFSTEITFAQTTEMILSHDDTEYNNSNNVTTHNEEIDTTNLEVNITCPKLKKVLVDKFDGSNGGKKDEVIVASEISQVKYMDLSNKGITDLTGLEKAVSLEKINLNNNQITSIEPLQDLSNLIDLRLNGNLISEVEQVALLNKLIANNGALKVYIKANKFDFNNSDLLFELNKNARSGNVDEPNKDVDTVNVDEINKDVDTGNVDKPNKDVDTGNVDEVNKNANSGNLDYGGTLGAKLIYDGETEIFLKGTNEFVIPKVLSPDVDKYKVVLSISEDGRPIEGKVPSFKTSQCKLVYKLIEKKTNRSLDVLSIWITIDQPPIFIYESKDKIYTGDNIADIFEDININDIPLLSAVDDFDGEVDVSMSVVITKDSGRTVYNVVYLAEDSVGNKCEFPISIDVS